MTDTGLDNQNVSLLDPIPLITDQILHVTALLAAQKLKKGVAVEVHCGRGKAYVPMGIDVLGGHLQLLIVSAGVNAQADKLLPKLFLPRHCGWICGIFLIISAIRPDSQNSPP